MWWVEAESASARLQHTNYAARVFAGGPQSGFAAAQPAMRCSISTARNALQRQHGPQCVAASARSAMRCSMIAKELSKAKPGAWGCVQTREMWSTDEQVHLRPGHHWLFESGDGGEGSSCEKLFSLPQRRTGVVYKGTRFYNGDRALCVKRWLHRVDEDATGLIFEEWDPIKDADDSQTPVPMIINSSKLRGAGCNLQEVIPPALEREDARAARNCASLRVWDERGLFSPQMMTTN